MRTDLGGHAKIAYRYLIKGIHQIEITSFTNGF